MTDSKHSVETELTALEVPAQGDYARVVRMTAANLATLAGFGIEEVDDVRMAAEEAFIYSLATNPGERLSIRFAVSGRRLSMDFVLGHDWRADDPDEPALAYSALILQAMCDVYEISDEPDITLHLEKEAWDANGR